MRTLIIGTLILAGLFWVWRQDFNDAMADEAYYREMVCGGYWPDYDNLQPRCAP